MTTKVFPDLVPAGYRPHALHAAERDWPETNCYVDLWIEVLASHGVAPEAMLGFTLTQDFEGDQFTFFKVPLEDLESLYGIRVTELAIFDTVEAHISEQLRRGRLCLVEMDSFYMPDTRGVAYHLEHGKTTVAINRLDIDGRSVDYFHNGGFFSLSGDDFDGLFQRQPAAAGSLPFLPYTEFAKFPAVPMAAARQRAVAGALLSRHFSRKPSANPVLAFAERFPDQARALAERDFAFFHKYAFNTLRQLGANFELLAAHLDWLWQDKAPTEASHQAKIISQTSKSVQFQLARALTRKKFDALSGAMQPAIDAWDLLMTHLERDLQELRLAA
ncbi:DUF1839 family protein [Rhizobium sp. SSA_523]|uniref:DUF1839 family protein n=1 Tax=Rhizobium sp. SSA_523 TaxID=2952477 RepID=UPI0020907093|nr:DUF1839 family protein [Rhizobium sp. SSA_523]MCO5734541.1 DUF1839 family protein [Rhizobium sp. SSA_523]WKC23323.1 DUF1839 family protein [Rhizobium sp. SSA_523]